jgi:hypothetical protein
MSEEQMSSNTWFSTSDALRQMQNLGAQLTGAARSMAEELSNSPAGVLTEPMARWGERTAELSTLWVAPVRAMLEEQQDLIDAVASWADQQRKLAERFADLAERHRALTEQVSMALAPALDHADLLAGRTATKSSASKKTTAKKTTARKRSASR